MNTFKRLKAVFRRYDIQVVNNVVYLNLYIELHSGVTYSPTQITLHFGGDRILQVLKNLAEFEEYDRIDDAVGSEYAAFYLINGDERRLSIWGTEVDRVFINDDLILEENTP